MNLQIIATTASATADAPAAPAPAASGPRAKPENGQSFAQMLGMAAAQASVGLAAGGAAPEHAAEGGNSSPTGKQLQPVATASPEVTHAPDEGQDASTLQAGTALRELKPQSPVPVPLPMQAAGGREQSERPSRPDDSPGMEAIDPQAEAPEPDSPHSAQAVTAAPQPLPLLPAGHPDTTEPAPAARPISPPALGLRRTLADGEPQTRGIEIAAARIDRAATGQPSPTARSNGELSPDLFTLDLPTAAQDAGRNTSAPRGELAAAFPPSQHQSVTGTGGSFASLLAPAQASDMEGMIDSLFSARESGRTARGEMVLRHGEFGPVALRIEQASAELRAILHSHDPGFAPAAQAALADRAIAAVSEAQQGQQRGHDQAPGHGSPRDGGASTAGSGRGSNPGGNPAPQHGHSQATSPQGAAPGPIHPHPPRGGASPPAHGARFA